MTQFWLAARLLLGGRRKLLSTAGWISLVGLIIGVASLVVSMAVISGFEYTLWKSVTDVAGHLQIFKLNPTPESGDLLLQKIKGLDGRVQEGCRFAIIEGVMANRGRLNGVYLQGVDEQNVRKVLNLDSRLIAGEFDIGNKDGVNLALVGKGIAKDFGLGVGDVFKIVIPINTDLDVSRFHRRVGTFKIAGILDLGKYEYDQRWIFTSLAAAQGLAEIGDRYSGLLLRSSQWEEARDSALKLSRGLGADFRVRDWHDINENLFSAVKIEKVAIFFVIFVIVLAAAFNVAISLYINVVKATPEIAVLRALGMTPKQMQLVFSLQGLILGFIGVGLGFLLGLIFCFGFSWLETRFGIIPGSVYKLDHIDLQIKFLDQLAILVATLGICGVATWAPARRAASLSVVEGLRNE